MAKCTDFSSLCSKDQLLSQTETEINERLILRKSYLPVYKIHLQLSNVNT